MPRKASNKENSLPYADPYDNEAQEVTGLDQLKVTSKPKPSRLKKASGRLLQRSPTLPLAEQKPTKTLMVDVEKMKSKPGWGEPEKPRITEKHPREHDKPTYSKPFDLPRTQVSIPVNKRAPDAYKSKRPHGPSVEIVSDLPFLEHVHPKPTHTKLPKVSDDACSRPKGGVVIVVSDRKAHQNKTRHQVFGSKDMLLLIARFVSGLELVRLSLTNTRIQTWLCDPNHRLWQDLCITVYKKFRCPKQAEDSWKRRYLQSLAICQRCDHYEPGAVVECVVCNVQYCGFNPPAGHIRFPSTPAVKHPVRRVVGMCYEHCWSLCWRCNDLIVVQNSAGRSGAVCRKCCPADRDVCEQCREMLLLARTKSQWDERKVARVLGLNDTSIGEFMELEDDNRSVASQRYERPMPPEDSIAETSSIFDPYC